MCYSWEPLGEIWKEKNPKKIIGKDFVSVMAAGAGFSCQGEAASAGFLSLEQDRARQNLSPISPIFASHLYRPRIISKLIPAIQLVLSNRTVSHKP